MYKEYLLKVINKNPILTESSPISCYIKMREKFELMTEEEAKEFLLEIRPTWKTGMSITPLLLGVGIPTYAVYRIVRSSNKCSSSCGTFALNTPKRQICMSKCKVLQLEEVLKAFKEHKASPGQIAKVESRLASAKKKFSQYQQYALSTGRNPNPKVDTDKESLFKIPD